MSIFFKRNMSNCNSKYMYFINNKNRKLNINNEDYVNVFLKIIKDARQIYKTRTQPRTQPRTQARQTTLNSQRVYPESILRNKKKNMNANTNSKSYEYFSRRINNILENPKLIHRRKRGRTTDNLRSRIRSKIREINLRKCGYYSKSFSTLISRL